MIKIFFLTQKQKADFQNLVTGWVLLDITYQSHLKIFFSALIFRALTTLKNIGNGNISRQSHSNKISVSGHLNTDNRNRTTLNHTYS